MTKNTVRNELDDFDILSLLLKYGADVNFHAKLVII
jgi:hypothetical protein